MDAEPARLAGGDLLRRAAFWSLATAVASITVSIAASQILLAAALVLAAWSRDCRGAVRPKRSLLIPWLLFIAWTIVTALMSHEVARGLTESRKFFLYSIVFLTPALIRSGSDLLKTCRAIFAISAVGASAGLIQFALRPSFDLEANRRISGFLSHWMTYSGLLMLVLVMLAAYALCIARARLSWWIGALALVLGAGMYLSQTRNSWLGSVAGLTVVFALKRPRLLLLLVGALAALFFLSPLPIQQRLRSGWDRRDPETRARLELAGTAMRLIEDNPWTGVGPKNVNRAALRYRGTTEFPDYIYQHMHNNALQIAAERGIPGLILWVWLIAQLCLDAAAVYRLGRATPEASMAATAALGCVAALLVAGMFEYNFGDSEVVTMFLFVMAAPYAFAGCATSAARHPALGCSIRLQEQKAIPLPTRIDGPG